MRTWLKNLREQKRMSQRDVADLVGISAAMYCFVENGKRDPSPRIAQGIAKALGFLDTWYHLLEPSSFEHCREAACNESA